MIAPITQPIPTPAHTPDPRIELVLNSGAGALDKRALGRQIVEFLEQRGIATRVHVISGAEVAGTAARVAAGSASIVVAGGGDGTITTVARHLVGTSKALGVLPLGTFNYFARNIGVPLELEPALKVLAGGHCADR